MPVEAIRIKNDAFRELKLRLRHNPRQSYIEIDNLLSNVQDKKAFIFLMDAYETEKEITREILEHMLDATVSINSEIIHALEEANKMKIDIPGLLSEIFNPKNLKALIIAAVIIGILISVSTNENVAIKIVDSVVSGKTQQENKDQK